ncbi:GNAT family N-acetyltransferase [Pelagibaculum spongiae]|uniref:N-acetyltransferase domain-containing protein n=1 Tax=Pelagibaculum spongiae TaxID=2080658 RepID=A0A2V1GTL7_9GAMM|nr:GNAT family N-acetyltransferase [Pelagibaculum spongiae]PVZ67726.1 hypothetical protein DC094_14935 [Pelagibaculum spongiae]
MTKPSVMLKKAQIKNARSIQLLWSEIYQENSCFVGQPASTSRIKELIASNRVHKVPYLLAFFGDQLIGSCEIIIRNNKALIGVMVDSKYRKSGTATRLINACLEYFNHYDKNTVYLWVLDRNLPAIQLYKKLGFIRTSSSPRPINKDSHLIEFKKP